MYVDSIVCVVAVLTVLFARWGPEFWGIMVNVFLFGIAVMQAFLYFNVYKQ